MNNPPNASQPAGTNITQLGSQIPEHFNPETYKWDYGFLTRVLGLFIHDKDFLPKYRKACDARYFSDEPYFHVSQKILEHFDQCFAPPPLPALAQRLGFHDPRKLPTNTDLIKRLTTVLYSSNIRMDVANMKMQLNEEILKFGKAQRVLQGLHKSLKLASKMEYESIIKEMMDHLQVENDPEKEIEFYFEGLDKRMEELKIRHHNRVSTGMELVDEQLMGGLAPGEMCVLLAGTNVGKTMAACNFAHGALLQGRKVLFFSTELEKRLIEMRLDTRISLVKTADFLRFPEEIKEKVRAFQSQISGDLLVQWYEPHKHTLVEARMLHETLKRQKLWYPDLIIIDSPDLFKPARRHRDRPDLEFADIYADIFAWGRKEQVAMVVTSDINKKYLKNRLIRREHTGGSYEKMKKPDIVIGIGQNEEMSIKQDDGHFEVWLNFDKVRNSPARNVLLGMVFPETCRWSPVRVLDPPEWEGK